MMLYEDTMIQGLEFGAYTPPLSSGIDFSDYSDGGGFGINDYLYSNDWCIKDSPFWFPLNNESSRESFKELPVVNPQVISNEATTDKESKPDLYSIHFDHCYVKSCHEVELPEPSSEEEKSIDVWNRDEESDVWNRDEESDVWNRDEESDVWNRDEESDVWNRDEESVEAPVLVPTPRRRNARRNVKAAKSVSIKRAAKVALEKTRPLWKEPPQKKRKVGYSVETTPSGSDYEDVVRPKTRGAKSVAMQAINSINSNTKVVKSEIQRTNHNENEKRRRYEMSGRMNDVRLMVPSEFYGGEAARDKASKQKVLNVCQTFVGHIAIECKALADKRTQIQKRYNGLVSIHQKLRNSVIEKMRKHNVKIPT